MEREGKTAPPTSGIKSNNRRYQSGGKRKQHLPGAQAKLNLQRIDNHKETGEKLEK